MPLEPAAMGRLFARWLVIGGLSVLAGLLLYGLTHKATQPSIDQQLSADTGVPVPAFRLKLVSGGDAPGLPPAAAVGRTVAPTDLRGRPFVLTFWSSWCTPCLQELPMLERTWQSSSKRVLLVGLNQQDSVADARSVVQSLHVTFPVLWDVSDATARRYGVSGTPETFFVTGGGEIVGHVIGGLSRADFRRGMRAAETGRLLARSFGGAREGLR